MPPTAALYTSAYVVFETGSQFRVSQDYGRTNFACATIRYVKQQRATGRRRRLRPPYHRDPVIPTAVEHMSGTRTPTEGLGVKSADPVLRKGTSPQDLAEYAPGK